MKRLRSSPFILTFLIGVLIGCAGTTTPKGAAQKAAIVVKEIGKTIRDSCNEAEATGWKYIPQQACSDMSHAYSLAWTSAKTAVDEINRNPSAKLDTARLVKISGFVIQTAGTLAQYGVKLPPEVTEYLEKVID